MEQFGRVLIEAQGCGVPVVGSDSGAIPEVIGEAGLIYPEGNSNALRAVLEKLKISPGLRQQLSEMGKQRVAEHYSWDSIAHQMRQIYRECYGRRAQGVSPSFSTAEEKG